MLSMLLRSKKVRRFFKDYFVRRELRFRDLDRSSQVPGEPSVVNWCPVGESVDFRDFYSFHDRNCQDVRGIQSAAWLASHFHGYYRQHLENDVTLDYSVEPQENGGIRIRSAEHPDTWVFLASRRRLPSVYAIEFDYLPRTVFKEQLQIDFDATSLADRHRFILTYNEYVRYQRIRCGFWLPDAGRHPFSLPIGETTRIRLEVVRGVFTLRADGQIIACWRNLDYRPRSARNYLLFWNGDDRREMDFTLSNLKIEYEKK